MIDEACGMGGSSLVVGERSGDGDRIHFARYLYRGESRDHLSREYFDVHYPNDAGMRRQTGLNLSAIIHAPLRVSPPPGLFFKLAIRRAARMVGFRCFPILQSSHGSCLPSTPHFPECGHSPLFLGKMLLSRAQMRFKFTVRHGCEAGAACGHFATKTSRVGRVHSVRPWN